MKIVYVVIALFAMSAPAFAQATKAPAPKKFAACDADTVDESGLTECERLLFKSMFSEAYPYQEALAKIDARMREAAAAVQAENPGKVYQAPTQSFPQGRMVPAPVAPSAAAPAPVAPKAINPAPLASTAATPPAKK